MKRKLELPAKEGRSKAFLELNPHVYAPAPTVAIPATVQPVETKLLRRRRKVMNKTEAMFARLLESQQARFEIISFDFEGLTLRWGNEETFTYTPDFLVTRCTELNGCDFPMVKLRFVEVKGAYIWPKDWDRFKHARDNWPNFEFQLWQYKQREWRRIG